MTYDSEVLTDSPLLYWKLDDAVSSTTAVDASGNSNAGAVTGWSFRQTSQFPGSVYGSTPAASGDKIVSPGIAFGSSGFVTVEMWVNFNGTTGTYMLWAFGALYLDLFIAGGNMGINTGTGDQWGCALPGSGAHHVVCVVPINAFTTTTIIYIDGVSQAPLGPPGGYGFSPQLNTTTFQVSGWPASGQFIPPGVYVDNVAVYTGALSSTRVLAHYNAGFSLGNDNFANAATVGGPSATTDATGGYTTEASEPLACPVDATAWYTFTPSTDGVYQIDTIGSNFDTGLSVYTGTALANLSRLAFDDDTGGSGTSRLVLELIGGTTYYIQGGAGPSAGTTTGSLVLNVSANLRAAPSAGWGAHA
jgi:hypothetical protein